MTDTLRIPFDTMLAEFTRVLSARGFTPERAERNGRFFAENSRDGVHSHGLNRFPSHVKLLDAGCIDPEGEAQPAECFGAVERWDGHHGPGPLNAMACMNRAMELAGEHGVGCVALRNTGHWMRAGRYAEHAAEAGCIGICWTNTTANLPPWGGTEPRLGNNPLAIGVPLGDAPLVLDMAMSQYSYGKLGVYQRSGDPLPLPGGYDKSGALTTDANAIVESQRALPVGYWKGAGLSLALDLVVTLLSGGRSTRDISAGEHEHDVSQLFLAFDLARIDSGGSHGDAAAHIIDFALSCETEDPASELRYPGQRALTYRRESLALGVIADPEIWARVTAL